MSYASSKTVSKLNPDLVPDKLQNAPLKIDYYGHSNLLNKDLVPDNLPNVPIKFNRERMMHNQPTVISSLHTAYGVVPKQPFRQRPIERMQHQAGSQEQPFRQRPIERMHHQPAFIAGRMDSKEMFLKKDKVQPGDIQMQASPEKAPEKFACKCNGCGATEKFAGKCNGCAKPKEFFQSRCNK